MSSLPPSQPTTLASDAAKRVVERYIVASVDSKHCLFWRLCWRGCSSKLRRPIYKFHTKRGCHRPRPTFQFRQARVFLAQTNPFCHRATALLLYAPPPPPGEGRPLASEPLGRARLQGGDGGPWRVFFVNRRATQKRPVSYRFRLGLRLVVRGLVLCGSSNLQVRSVDP